jgi:hypothetical protein
VAASKNASIKDITFVKRFALVSGQELGLLGGSEMQEMISDI